MSSKKVKIILFWITEAALIIAALSLTYLRVRINTAAFFFVGLAILLGIYGVLYLYAKKHPKSARVIKITFTSMLVFSLAALLTVQVPIISAAKTDRDVEADYVIVLGAGINGTVPSMILYQRLVAAKDYLDTYPQAKAVVSGGQGPGEDITEAESMRRWLENNGIAPERILMEEKSTSTYENLQYSLEIIGADGGDTRGKIAIISNEFHLYRSKYMAKEFGVQPVGIAASTSNFVLMVNYFIREAFAVMYMWIM